MLNMGMMPLGALVIGAGADLSSAPTAVMFSGLAVLAATTAIGLLSKRLRDLRLSDLTAADAPPTRSVTPVSAD
jgi:hypothetical protein